jgi:acetyltransferase-like isoleucine patch superfamily enzyme
MKTHPLDFLLSGCIIFLLVSTSSLSISVISPLTVIWSKNYHIVIDAIIFLLLYGIYSAVLIRICLKVHPIKPGSFSMEDSHFFYWKFITVIHEFGRGCLLPFTTVFAKPVVSSLFGAKMGKNIAMGGFLVDPWLITVSDNAILGLNSAIISHAITSGRIILKPVIIHKGSTVGVHCVIMPGVSLGENSVVVAGSVVKMDTNIPPNELWGGTPARKIKDIDLNDIRG